MFKFGFGALSSSYFLEEGDNYIMNDFNNRRARKHENEVGE